MIDCICNTVMYCSLTCKEKHRETHQSLCVSSKDPLITLDHCQQAMQLVSMLQENKELNVDEPVIVALPSGDQPIQLISIDELEKKYPSMDISMKETLSQMVDEQQRWMIHVLWFTQGQILHRILRGRFPEVEDLYPFKAEVNFTEEEQDEAYWSTTVLCKPPSFGCVINAMFRTPVPPRGKVTVTLTRGDNRMTGSLQYSTKAILNPLPQIPGVMFISSTADHQHDMEVFHILPMQKIVKLYVGDRVVHLLLKKMSAPQAIHRDHRYRTMVYYCHSIQLIKRQEANIDDLPKQCLVCCAKAKHKCSVCGVHYCSVDCQKADWKSHKRSHKRKDQVSAY